MDYAKAKALASNISNALQQAQPHLEQTQHDQARQANKKRRPVEWKAGDKVFVSRLLWINPRRKSAKKLVDKWAGPYVVLRQVGQAWEVDLPPGVQAHRVINPEHLRKAAADPLPGQHNAPPPAENVIGEDEWEVESIQDSSLRYRNNGLWYQVKWVGYEDPDNSWHKASDLKYAPDKII